MDDERPPKARHSWGEPYRTAYRTDRTCVRCGILRVTRHEPAQFPWQEFERDGAMMPKRPECVAAKSSGTKYPDTA